MLTCIGSLAYKLELPASSSVHPIFHISQLKPVVLLGVSVTSDLPTDIELPRVPVSFLQHRMVPNGPNQVEQMLVQWSDWPIDMSTWETLDTICEVFPYAPAWGQAGPQAPGNVSTAATTFGLDGEVNNGPRQSIRGRRPNKNVIGETWA